MDTNFLIHVAHAAEAASEASESGVAAVLGLNLKLFIAQLLNFGIVLFVLWKWVFTPVTKALTARTKKIEESLSNAEKIEQDRVEFSVWKDKEIQTARLEAGEIIKKAKTESESLKEKGLQETKQAQSDIIEKTKIQLEAETKQAVNSAKSQLAELITTATEKILSEKIDSKKDKELIHNAVEQLTK